MNKSGTFGIIPSFSIIALAVGLMNHVMVLPPLLQSAHRDAWISVLSTLPPYLIWTLLMYGVMKGTKQQPLLPWLRQHYGQAASLAFRVFFVVYLLCISVLTLKETTEWAHNSYLPRTPELALSLSLTLACGIGARYGVRTIAIASGMLLPWVIIFGDFVMSANLPAKNYGLLQPYLENGWGPVLQGSIHVGGGLVELVILLLFQHQIKSNVKLWKLLLLSVFLVMLVIGPVTGAIAEFGPYEAANLRYPSYEEWRLVRIGKYIRHVDFLSIYQWLSGAFVRISISLFLIAELFQKQGRKQSRLVWLWIFGVINVILVQLPVSDMQYLAFLRGVYLPASLWGVTGVLLLLFAAAQVSGKKKEKQA